MHDLNPQIVEKINEALQSTDDIHRLCREFKNPMIGIYANGITARLTEVLDIIDQKETPA
tara:strand:- start:929 stop:1108 length:180 start_codon:yes stop_codon:yes gene_type:complete